MRQTSGRTISYSELPTGAAITGLRMHRYVFDIHDGTFWTPSDACFPRNSAAAADSSSSVMTGLYTLPFTLIFISYYGINFLVYGASDGHALL
jgi:hypothetical protein